MKNFVKLLSAAVLLAISSVSCVREVNPAQQNGRPVSLGFDFNFGEEATKSILTDANLEYKLSNVLVILYRSGSGLLDKTFVCDGGDSEVSLLTGIDYDIFFLANVENPAALRVPLNESGLESFSYVIPSYESVDRLGVPSCAVLRSVRVSQDSHESVVLQRLMSKVQVCIFHGGLTGRQSNDKAVFSNVKLYVRNANARLLPFSAKGSAPQTSADIMEQSDYDPVMDAERQNFVFYVPENIQGQLLPYNLDPLKKSAPELQSKGIDVSRLTYIEYTGRLNPSVGGYGGELLYRFYLGADNVGDFNIERNSIYSISLNLTDRNLFDPCWKISHGEDWQDKRCLRLLSSDSKVLGDDAVLAVRPSHPAVISLFMNTDGSASNMVSSSELASFASEDSDLGLKLAWSSNVRSRDQQSLVLPGTMAAEGLRVSYDASNASISVSVDNAPKTVTGKEYELEFFLLPGREFHIRRLRVKVLPDCVADNIPECIYVAQEFHPQVRGALGTYTARVVSGGDCVDVGGDDALSVIGKKKGSACVELTSDDKVNDEDLRFNLSVGNIYYFGIIGDEMMVDCDGEKADMPFSLASEFNATKKLDINDFNPEYLRKYYPAEMTFTSPFGEESMDDFYEVDPYTLTARVKKLIVNGRNLVDLIREDRSSVDVRMKFPLGPTIEMNLDARPPFLEDMYQVGDFKLGALWEHKPSDTWDFRYACWVKSENISWNYSGKMDPVFDSPYGNRWQWTLTFSYKTQQEHLKEDLGRQCVWPTFRNIVSGETQDGPRLYFEILKKY